MATRDDPRGRSRTRATREAPPNWALLIGANVLGVVFLLALVELGFTLAIRFPPSSGVFRDTVDHWYMHWERSIVQYEPRCTRFDAELAYTLRPGRCRFANREFDVQLAINSLGVRDEERALVAPAVVMLGDSFTMGWGVGQEEAFPQRFAKLSGRRVLNAGVSSYGTVRELKLLRRIDTSAMTDLVIQYACNDEQENRFAAEHGNELEIMSEAELERLTTEHAERRRYFPGKYVRRFLPLWVEHARWAGRGPARPPADDPSAEVDAFLAALAAAHVDLSRVQVVVFELNGHDGNDDRFTSRLAERSAEAGRPRFLHRLRTVDVASLLTADDYFFYDDHLNPRGHEKIAHALLALGARSPSE
jgi:hypothetical protein